MRNVLGEICREKNTFLYSVASFPKIFAVCRITWKNVVEPDRSQMTIF